MGPQDHFYYGYGNQELYRIKDGSKTITPVEIKRGKEEEFKAAVKSGNTTIDGLKGLESPMTQNLFLSFILIIKIITPPNILNLM